MSGRWIDLSHTIEDGLVTYKGLPAPHICDFWTREQSKAFYDDGASFHIGRIDMVANTGTYLDAPFHRWEDGLDIAELPLERLASLDAIVVRRPHGDGLAVDVEHVSGLPVQGKAVLVHTGWDAHWGTDRYFDDHPYLTAEAARWLVEQGAGLVGIDSHNIDDTRTRTRPVHSELLRAGIPIVEHLTNLQSIPDEGSRFTAAPPKVSGLGTFPVRAYAEVP